MRPNAWTTGPEPYEYWKITLVARPAPHVSSARSYDVRRTARTYSIPCSPSGFSQHLCCLALALGLKRRFGVIRFIIVQSVNH